MSLPRVVAALIAAFMVATVLSPTQPAGAAEDDASAPLTVQLTELTPAAIPTKGRIVLAGTVRNDSTEIWSAINVHPVISSVPMTTREQLAAAAASAPSTEIVNRLLKLGQFDPIGDLAPGQSAPFRISLASRDLPISRSPGVYWIGVHALGQNAEGRDRVADGRAWTFIPLVSADAHTSVSLVVPLRERVRRDNVGRLLDPSAWSATLGDGGRLERIAALLDTAGGLPATMLVDPAVIDAAGSIAANNPALSLGKQPPPGQTPGGSPSPSPSDQASRSLDRLDPTDRDNAVRWLAQVKEAAQWQTVLGLGYADPDTAALARQRPGLLRVAVRQSATAFKRLGIDAVPAVAPPTGWLNDQALGSIAPETMVLLSDQAAPRTRTMWRTPERQDLIFTDEAAASGGPGPTAPLDALAVRQRIVSDAALRAEEGFDSPMVVDLPGNWDPGADWQSADFFAAMNLPWLDLQPLDGAPADAPVFDAALGYPSAERRSEIGLPNAAATRTLVTTANVMGQLLRSTNDVQYALTAAALDAVSYHARRDRARAREQVIATNTTMRGELDKVAVIGTDFVTLGGSGTLTVTMVNQLKQPVTVGIRPTTSTPGVRIQTPKPLEMAPGQRTVLRLPVRASSIGVHEVTLTPVTVDGAQLGTPLTFSLRTSEVGRLIWGVIVGGGGLLVVMIVRRIRRGIREHRWRGQ